MILIHLIVQGTAPGLVNDTQKSTFYSINSHHRATRSCLTLLDCALICTADLSLPALSSISRAAQAKPAEQLPPWLSSLEAGHGALLLEIATPPPAQNQPPPGASDSPDFPLHGFTEQCG